MNQIATIMNLRINFQNEYRLHKDTSNLSRNKIIMDYHQQIKSLLRDCDIHLGQDNPQNTLSFAQYFNDVLDNIPKNSADDNYHKLMYIIDIAFMESTDIIKQFHFPITDRESFEQDDSKSVLQAIHQFNKYQASEEKQGVQYRFVSLKVTSDHKQVLIDYVNQDQFQQIKDDEALEKKEGEEIGK